MTLTLVSRLAPVASCYSTYKCAINLCKLSFIKIWRLRVCYIFVKKPILMWSDLFATRPIGSKTFLERSVSYLQQQHSHQANLSVSLASQCLQHLFFFSFLLIVIVFKIVIFLLSSNLFSCLFILFRCLIYILLDLAPKRTGKRCGQLFFASFDSSRHFLLLPNYWLLPRRLYWLSICV